MSLDGLAQLPLETRCAFILESGQTDLNTSLELLREQGFVAPQSLTLERLAWAVAFNVTGPSIIESAPQATGRRVVRGYQDKWPRGTEWDLIWSTLVKPQNEGNPSPTTFLSELALSVACEQREDWQNPAARPLNLAEAVQAFDFVYVRDAGKVVKYVTKAFRDQIIQPGGNR
jgi:hypothetical protein